MRRPFAVILLLLLVVSAGAYFWYRQLPEQQIKRTVDQLFDNIEHQPISTRRPIDVEEALKEVLSPIVTLSGSDPIPNDDLSNDDLIEKVALLHSLSKNCEITIIDQFTLLEGKRAQVTQTIEVSVTTGLNYNNTQKWELVIDLEESEDWRIVAITGRQL